MLQVEEWLSRAVDPLLGVRCSAAAVCGCPALPHEAWLNLHEVVSKVILAFTPDLFDHLHVLILELDVVRDAAVIFFLAFLRLSEKWPLMGLVETSDVGGDTLN